MARGVHKQVCKHCWASCFILRMSWEQGSYFKQSFKRCDKKRISIHGNTIRDHVAYNQGSNASGKLAICGVAGVAGCLLVFFIVFVFVCVCVRQRHQGQARRASGRISYRLSLLLGSIHMHVQYVWHVYVYVRVYVWSLLFMLLLLLLSLLLLFLPVLHVFL